MQTHQVRVTRRGLRHLPEDRCQKCGQQMLYEDYEPAKSHHGWTCGACGTEQLLGNDLKSLIDPTRPKHRRVA